MIYVRMYVCSLAQAKGMRVGVHIHSRRAATYRLFRLVRPMNVSFGRVLRPFKARVLGVFVPASRARNERGAETKRWLGITTHEYVAKHGDINGVG